MPSAEFAGSKRLCDLTCLWLWESKGSRHALMPIGIPDRANALRQPNGGQGTSLAGNGYSHSRRRCHPASAPTENIATGRGSWLGVVQPLIERFVGTLKCSVNVRVRSCGSETSNERATAARGVDTHSLAKGTRNLSPHTIEYKLPLWCPIVMIYPNACAKRRRPQVPANGIKTNLG
jgi:hypothetical protein